MATVIKVRNPQALTEIRIYPCDFTKDLLTGVTVNTATATHTPPSGSSTSPGVSVVSPIAYVTFGPVTVTGTHKVSVLGTCSNGEKVEILLVIPVKW